MISVPSVQGEGILRSGVRPIKKGWISLQQGPARALESEVKKAGESSVAEVHIQDGETLENALRRFKRKVQQEDIIKEVKRHSFYLKPGEKARVKQALARKRNRKKNRREVE